MNIVNVLKMLIFIPIFGACALSENLSCQTQRQASFDIGSGSTKFMLAEISPCEKNQVKILIDDSEPVPYAQDLAGRGDRKFGKEIILRGEKTIESFIDRAKSQGDFHIRAVATQAFREASNGKDIIEKWQQKYTGDWKVISQDQEAQLAYSFVEKKTATMNRLLVWDIGGGSQQLVWRKDQQGSKMQRQKSTLASVSFKNSVMKHLKRDADLQSPNPLTLYEQNKVLQLALDLIAKEKNHDLKNWLSHPAKIVGIGGVHGGSLKNQLGLREGERITQDEIRHLLLRKQNYTDEQIGGAYASTEITNLILVLAMMMTYEIADYEVMGASLTEALIVESMR